MKRAFTLIELLVVIAIIAILAAILFPVFAQAKVAAKKTTSLSNLKQATTAQIMYAGDSEDIFPLVMAATHNAAIVDGYASTDYTWQNLVQPYAKNWQLMVSPLSRYQRSDPKLSNDVFFNYGMSPNSAMAGIANFGDTYYSGPPGVWGPTIKWNGVGGAYNDLEFWGFGGDPSDPSTMKGGNSLSQSNIARVAEQVLLADSTGPDMWGTYSMGGDAAYQGNMFGYCWTWGGQLVGSSRAGAIARAGRTGGSDDCGSMKAFGGQITTAFADGHAQSLPVLRLYQQKTLADTTKAYTYWWPGE
jgi:prepilin-type N-terminal cleavage/methylation domain-containing protein